jgi:4-hydroxybenzoate polyprenyltransferase
MIIPTLADETGSPSAPRFAWLFDRYFLARPVLMSPVWTIALLAAAHGQYTFNDPLPTWSTRIWAGLTLCFFLYGGVYVFNQIFDIESDRINDKLYFLPRNIISVGSALIQYAVLTVVALVGSWWMGRVWLYAAVAIALLGVLYSLPPIRLKDRPFAGLLSNAIGHGTLVYYLGAVLNEPNSVPPWGMSSSYALAVAGVYVLTTIPDRAGDRMSGKITISTRFGPRPAAAIATVFVLAAAILGVVYEQWPLAISAGVSLPFFATAIATDSFCGPAVRVALLGLTFFACLVFRPYVFVILLLYLTTRWYYRRRFRVSYPRMSGGG